MRHYIRSGSPLIILLLTLFVIHGCDSGDPIDDLVGGTSPAAGTYRFEEFMVDPDADAIAVLNMLDTLVQDDTRLQLFEGGDFVLTYRYLTDPTAAVFGKYTASSREVRLQGDATASDRHNLRQLLMESTLILQRSQDSERVLATSFKKNVDLAAVSDRYRGVPPVAATVRVRLREVALP